MATYRYNIPSSGGTYTAATLDSECEIENQISVSGNTIFNEIVTPGSIAFDGTNLVFTAKASQATSEREGYAEVNYTIHGNECKKCMHLVQEAPPTPKATLRLSNGTIVTVPRNGDSVLKRNEMTSLVTASDVVSVHVEDCVTKIGDYAFMPNDFTNLTSITMADSVTEIGQAVHNAPYGGAPLKSISFSNNLVSIGDSAFWGCDKLTSLNFPNRLQKIEYGAFYKCTGITSVVLPDSVKTLGSQCFYNCSSVTGVTFGTGFTGIEGYGQCFEYTDISKVICKAVTPPVIDQFMFCPAADFTCKDRIRVYVPRNSISAYEQASGWNYYYIDDGGI